MRRYAKVWAKERDAAMAAAYAPLSFSAGEACRFDWSHEAVLINGVTSIVIGMRISGSATAGCYSCGAYPRESQERVFDAPDRAFGFFRGGCSRGIYDNMKTAADAVFLGKDRPFNRRFLQMCGHYRVELESERLS